MGFCPSPPTEGHLAKNSQVPMSEMWTLRKHGVEWTAESESMAGKGALEMSRHFKDAREADTLGG